MFKKIISTKDKYANTGIKLSLNSKYKIKLTEIKPIYDMFTKSDFSGWLSTKGFYKQRFHDLIQKRSRMPEAKIFSLIGEINDKQIDLGKIWKLTGQAEFEIDLKDYFENDSSEAELFVYFNDVNRFYWNNKGSYKIEIEKI